MQSTLDKKSELISAVCDLAKEKLSSAEKSVVCRYIEIFWRGVAPDDILHRDALDLYGTALAQYRFAARREKEIPSVRVYNPTVNHHGWQSTHTILEIINDDMPFLVDSVVNELNRQGLVVHLVIHPVICVSRNEKMEMNDLDERSNRDWPKESHMHIEIDRQSDAAMLANLEQDILRILGDVRNAVRDWREMRSKVATTIEDLAGSKDVQGHADYNETIEFLKWMAEDNFTFLGYSSYQIEGNVDDLQLRRVKGTGLGILSGKDDGALSESFKSMPAQARQRAKDPLPAIAITKAFARSTVHRSTFLDYVGVKIYSSDGDVVGEHRFLGLFTSAAYNRSPSSIPILRRKIQQVRERSGIPKESHGGKALTNILETHPRDELFQSSTDELFETATQILYLQERQIIRVFMRRDPFDRFAAVLIFVPRERYNTELRHKMKNVLEREFHSTESDFQASISESTLARILFTIRTPKGFPASLDVRELEKEIQETTQSWGDHLREAVLDHAGEEEGNRLLSLYQEAFPPSYQDVMPARSAVPDIQAIEQLKAKGSASLSKSLYRRLEDEPSILRFKLIRPDNPIYLSDALPILENMGLRILYEEPHTIEDSNNQMFSIHDFGMKPVDGTEVDVDQIRTTFQHAFEEIWTGRVENDGFNRLVLTAGLTARQIDIVRAYAKYMVQLGNSFSQNYVEQTFISNTGITKDLVSLFDTRFNPELDIDRTDYSGTLEMQIASRLDEVASLDEDRILRRFLGLIKATLRTNAYQPGNSENGFKPYISFKFDPSKVPGMPLPRPAYEIFVFSPRVEGVHLRGGKVARGGLRWSDRREDFRTEVLGLVKAQMVKNSVIVPVGAKGGFVVKQPPQGGDRQAFLDEGIACYKTFLSGLLDITDNQLTGEIIHPEHVIRYDDDDPYLVVAADKGTATFSDIANGVSEQYGFWLGDAFASGGSAGYDHKGMGITAKGAWESVKRHFREMGIDTQNEPFTVVGIGDMSGDVFGNGMLLSEHIRLVAAFDHRHIFLDPAPDCAKSFAERKRLFELGRSSWADYNSDLISKGGGVFARNVKTVPLSPEIRKVLDITAESLQPLELINAILKAPVDLFWNGGIGTYVKASSESHADAQDRSNDTIRINGNELRVKVVGEGGNLGLTQKGRIEYALAGGRIDTDFIDNSAGVDCSDHEVNIKILLGEVVRNGDLTVKQRDKLLAEMTDEVADLCLRDNILQNLALSMNDHLGLSNLEAQIQFMHKLEAQDRLDRGIELLPSDQELQERAMGGQSLTRPESAVLLAYAKTTLYADLLDTSLPDREYFVKDLAKYFPRPIRRRYPDEITSHRLRREIVATWLSNSIVNRGLDIFISELSDDSGADLETICMAYVITRDTFGLLPLWSEVEVLEFSVKADDQIAILNEMRETLNRGSRWYLNNLIHPISMRESVAAYQPAITDIMQKLSECLSSAQRTWLDQKTEEYRQKGLPEELADRIAQLQFLLSACDIVKVGHSISDANRLEIASVYFAIDQELNFAWLRRQILRAKISSRWERMALIGLEGELSEALRELTAAAIEAGLHKESKDVLEENVTQWCRTRLNEVTRFRALLSDVGSVEQPDLAMLSVAVSVANKLLSS